jgi:Fe-Mn family superoxide dismutase
MQQKMQRRTFIRGAGLIAGTAFAATITQISALAEATSNAGHRPMSYDIKPLSFDPKNIKGLSERLLVSHYENNYSGAVKRLNMLTARLAELDFAKAPVFVINGLKREELIAANSMILHELYFDGLGGGGAPSGALGDASESLAEECFLERSAAGANCRTGRSFPHARRGILLPQNATYQ